MSLNLIYRDSSNSSWRILSFELDLHNLSKEKLFQLKLITGRIVKLIEPTFPKSENLENWYPQLLLIYVAVGPSPLQNDKGFVITFPHIALQLITPPWENAIRKNLPAVFILFNRSVQLFVRSLLNGYF